MSAVGVLGYVVGSLLTIGFTMYWSSYERGKFATAQRTGEIGLEDTLIWLANTVEAISQDMVISDAPRFHKVCTVAF